MERTPVIAVQEAGVLTLILNRPQRLNAMNPALIEAVNHELARARDDQDIRAVLLTGTGRGFCAGEDMRESLRRNQLARVNWRPAAAGRCARRQVALSSRLHE